MELRLTMNLPLSYLQISDSRDHMSVPFYPILNNPFQQCYQTLVSNSCCWSPQLHPHCFTHGICRSHNTCHEQIVMCSWACILTMRFISRITASRQLFIFQGKFGNQQIKSQRLHSSEVPSLVCYSPPTPTPRIRIL